MWSVASGECLLTFEGHRQFVISAVFSADGQQVLTASYDCTAKVWWTASGECLLTLEGHGHAIFSAVFSADDQQVLTASWDTTAKVWSAASGECLLTLEGHDDKVLSAVFSADDQQVLTASHDGTAKVVGCIGRVLAHVGGSRRQGSLCGLFRRRPAGADCLLRRHREGVVGCLWRGPANIQRSRGICRLCSLLSMRLKRFNVEQWCGDGVSDCLGTVRRTFAGSEISVDTHCKAEELKR